MPDGPVVVVDRLRRIRGNLWGADVTLEDGSVHHLVMPEDVASLHAVQLSAAAVATFYADRAARHAG